MKEDPPLDFRCRDKFLVQSVFVPQDNPTATVSQIWANVEQTGKGGIQEKKIRVSFLPADGQREVNGGASPPPPAYESMTTPQKSPSTAAAAAVTPSEGKSDHGAGGDNEGITTAARGIVTSAAAAVGSSVGVTVSQEDLQRQLDAANAKVQALQEQVAEGLRQRKIVGGGRDQNETKGSIQQQVQPVGGVPVQIVAILCLVCFLIAYFFF